MSLLITKQGFKFESPLVKLNYYTCLQSVTDNVIMLTKIKELCNVKWRVLI